MNLQPTFVEEIDSADELPPGTVLLHGQYVIESYLVRGGFGITYLARDSLDRIVVIKECFPAAICCRVGGNVQARSQRQADQFASVLRHFIREARRLSRLHHPDIVGVHQVFEERDTAYMALDHVNGSDLLTILEDTPGRLTPTLVGSLLGATLGAISYIHDQGILHRDISPDNILLDRTDSPTLIDFGAAREQATRENRALSALLTVKDGYSPQEFYLSDEPQRPSSDLYSLGATFYHVLTGEAPPHSQQRLSAVAAQREDPYLPLEGRIPGYDPRFLATIDRALAIFPDDRFQTAAEWKAAIEAAPCSLIRTDTGESESDILRAISKLIVETGQDSPKSPAPRQERASRKISIAPAPEQPEHQAQTRQFVDMFGNPIDDVDAWMVAQEKERDRRRAKPVSRDAPDFADGDDEFPAERSGFFSNFWGRKSQRRRVVAETET